jgi:molybdopterin synthase catalytic subunit
MILGDRPMMNQGTTRITRLPIDVAALVREVEHARVGAVATFVGVVRAESRGDGTALAELEYTAHESMALAEMQRIAAEVAAAHAVNAVSAVHRLGNLKLGEASVAVVVSAPHRAAAFAACREVIEKLKADVPVFKREIWADGAGTWVHDVSDDGTGDDT